MNTAEDALTTEDIVCPGGMPAYLARPSGGGPYPVVLLMHERYGLVTHTREQARRCARDGYLVLAPNVFFRHPDQEALAAGNARYDLTDGESVLLLKSALAALENNPYADNTKIAVAGYCQTGRHPLIFAAEVPIAAAIVWYGAASKREWQVDAIRTDKLEDALAALRCPVFGAFGEKDHIISIADVLRFRNALEEHKKSYDIHLYAGAPHGWLNDTMPGRYRKAQAQAAWAAQQRFLAGIFAGRTDASVTWQFTGECAPDYDFAKNKRLE